MRIVFVTEYYPTSESAGVRGGVELRTFRLAGVLAKKHEVFVIAVRESGNPVDSTIQNVRILRVGPEHRYHQSGGLFTRLLFLVAARRIAMKLEPEIISLENYLAYGVGLTLPARWRARCVLTYHDVWIGEAMRHLGLIAGFAGEIIERLTLRHHWLAYIANSEVTKSELITHGVEPRKIHVVYNGVDYEKCASTKPEIFAQPTIVSVARLVKYKNLDLLLRAFHKIHQIQPGMMLLVIGTGPEAKHLKDHAQSLGLSKCVQWRGYVPKHADVLAAIRGATVFTLPSSVEGFGLVTAEAMACGTPYVSSDIPPTREITNAGKGGILFPDKNITKFAEGLLTIVGNENKRRQYRVEGQQRAKMFDWQHIGTEYLSQIERLHLEIQ